MHECRSRVPGYHRAGGCLVSICCRRRRRHLRHRCRLNRRHHRHWYRHDCQHQRLNDSACMRLLMLSELFSGSWLVHLMLMHGCVCVRMRGTFAGVGPEDGEFRSTQPSAQESRSSSRKPSELCRPKDLSSRLEIHWPAASSFVEQRHHPPLLATPAAYRPIPSATAQRIALQRHTQDVQ